MSLCFFGISVVFFLIGFVMLLAPDSRATSAPVRATAMPPRVSSRPVRINPGVAPAAAPKPVGGATMTSAPSKLEWVKVGQRIKIPHRVKGELTEHVLGRIHFVELWQQARGAQNPWVPTGNQFAGFWLDGEMLLLNWQNRFYLLDEHEEVSDATVQRDFLPHARKFAQSEQTADVYFAYPPASWHIDDIGKYQVGSIEGAALNLRPGAIGRFVHASGDGGRALVLEDYESGGQDVVWTGYQLQETDIRPA